TEGGDVLLHPGKRRDDVEHPLVARGRVLAPAELAEVQIAEETQPVIARHDHDVVGCSEVRAVLDVLTAGPGGESAAMAIEHHRPPAAIPDSRRPHVEHQAIFAAGGLMLPVGGAGSLHRRRPEAGGVANPRPWSHLRSFLEAIPARYRSGVGNALERKSPAAMTAANPAAVDFDFDEGADRLLRPRGLRRSCRQQQKRGADQRRTGFQNTAAVVRLWHAATPRSPDQWYRYHRSTADINRAWEWSCVQRFCSSG